MVTKRRIGALLGATALTGGLAVGASIAAPGMADAGVCTGLNSSAGSCSTLGTATLTGGGLTMVSPTALTWVGFLTGTSQTLYDTIATDTFIDVLDLRGLLSTSSGSGWNITASATPFTGKLTGDVIPDDSDGEVLAFGGGGTPAGAVNVPTSVCVLVGTCTPATDELSSYPVSVPTSSSATPPTSTIYEAAAGSGTGIVQVGGSAFAPGTNPAVWSVTLPATIAPDAYTSTITMTIAASP
jgi:hypothetical protein